MLSQLPDSSLAARRPISSLRLLLLAGLLVAGCSADAEQSQANVRQAADAPNAPDALTPLLRYFNQQWAMDKLWEDGKAEVATYDAERLIYNKKRSFEYVQVVVKEEFNREFNVKTDDYNRADLFPVIKVNQFCRIETDNYPYHFLTSIFFRRDQPVSFFKLTTSSQEWCGNTFKTIVDDGVNLLQRYNSYWDGQGEGSRNLRREVLLEDALPYTLRALRFEEKPAFEASVLGLQQTSQVEPPTYYKTRFSTAEAAPGDVPEPAWHVTAQLAPDKKNDYWFAKEYPNVLLRQTTWDGRSLTLKNVRRNDYWTRK